MRCCENDGVYQQIMREQWFVSKDRDDDDVYSHIGERLISERTFGERWFVLKIPRCDTNGVGEYEVTVTSERHAQAEKNKEAERTETATS